MTCSRIPALRHVADRAHQPACIGNRGADLALAGGAILEAVGDSGRGSPIAAAWLSADRHEHSGPGGGPIENKADHKIEIEWPSHVQRDQLRELLLTGVPAGKAS